MHHRLKNYSKYTYRIHCQNWMRNLLALVVKQSVVELKNFAFIVCTFQSPIFDELKFELKDSNTKNWKVIHFLIYRKEIIQLL